MFGVLISYLPNFNVGQENGMANATGSWNNGKTLPRSPRKRERERINNDFEPLCEEEK